VKKPFAIHDQWGKEHNALAFDRVGYTDAMHRCEMCGAVVIDRLADGVPERSAGEIIYRLALINQQSPLVLQVLLRRVMYMTGGSNLTLEEIACDVINAKDAHATMTKQALYDLCKRSVGIWPELQPYLTPKNKRAAKSASIGG
jgi:hypothetical protein